MKTIEVKNVSTFEPDVGVGKLLAVGATEKVLDTDEIRTLVADGTLRVIEKPLTPAQQKKADEEAAADGAAVNDNTPPDGETGDESK